MEDDKPVHYFTGRVRAFWKGLVFFSDARNVAVIDIHDLYINGKQASSKDLRYLEDLVKNSDWKQSPELHSYVSEYLYDVPTPWPYQLSGKALWKAKCAWLGWIPNCIKNASISNIVHMPISYYTGMVKKIYNDKILFGDMRNDVMVSSDNVYVSGERGFKRNTHDHLADWTKIHAYIIRLDVLTDMHLSGPEPDLPIWPKESFSSDMWVAKFAWFGDMPNEVRDQVGRYYVIRMNQWGNICNVPWKDESAWQASANKKSWKERCDYEDKQRIHEREIRPCQLLMPTEQPAGYMRGSLLLADSKQALMTSYVDLIAFSKDNFYVNGQKFKYNYDLSFFFQNRRVPLNAWVIPFDKPKVIFNINVVWHALCVWYGSPPKDLEYIKSACGKTVDDLVESNSSVTLTHFLGNVHDLYSDSGELMSKAGLDQSVKVSFTRKVLYMYGSKFHIGCSLLDKQQVLQNNIWSVLAYPVLTDQANGIPHYQALVMWRYDDQHSMNVISKIITEFVDETKNYCKRKEKVTQHMSGYIEKVSDDYGIMRIVSASVDNTYLYFRKEVLYIDGKLFPKDICLQVKEQGRQCNAEGKTMLPKNIDGYQVTMEATLLWIGRKPSVESGKFTPDCSENPQHVQITDCSDYKELCAAKMQTECYTRPGKVLHIAEGVKVGSIFIVDKHYGLVICSNIIAAFSSDTFYVNGDKFSNKYSSLDEFCSDRKITVRAVIVTLKAPKVVLNCAVMCEAICTWIGQEPRDLTHLQKQHLIKKNRSDIPKLLHKSLLYFVGKISPVSKDVALLASTTPEGTSKVLFSKENVFINGSVVAKDDIFEKWKRTSSHSWWSVLACPISTKDIMGHSVCYSAVAVWDMSHHHKMRKVLPLVACQLNDKPDKQEHCSNGKFSGSNKATLDTPEALLHNLQLKDSSKEKLLQVKGSSQLNDSSEIISSITKESSKDDTIVSSIDLALYVSKKEFCGKHITGYIVKKTGRGGVAQWKSQLFEGFVFIEFSIESLYLDLELIVEIWRVSDVKSRPCNFYVIPVPHHKVGEYMVSLKATCGWMGKKPSHLPSPGTQLLAKIDLSSVHVTQPNDIQDSELEMVQVPRACYQNGNTVNERNPAKNPVQLELSVTNEKFKNKMQETKNEEASRTGCEIQKPAQPVLPSKLPNADKNKCGKIWEDKNKKKVHRQGTIVEVHSSVGQLKGEDGSLHYFPRESCYLYGVPLHNVELWHVLAQDDPVLYTVMELVPGMMKVQKVWLGALELPDKKIASEYIFAWCQMKLVPDGARDILISQLEML
ncbi:uncharacterized protein LOC135106972 [Scylla paramamosain]|uniref:uncharacterized protein LOC135106972 n=1 Tax=Scylla paramamosain TaxID=85552 RepID=UPI003083CE28